MMNKRALNSAWIAPKRGASPRRASSHDTPTAALLNSVVDYALLGILFVAPLFFGGRHDLGRFVFVLLAVVMAMAWIIRQAFLNETRWSRTVAHWVLLLAVTTVALQLVPLPQQLLTHLSPRTADLLPLWSTDSANSVELGVWRTLSLTPGETQISLALLVAYSLLFVTTVQRLRDLDDIERLLRWIALAAMAMAGLGVLQYFTSNGRFFWFYDHPFRDTFSTAQGSFTNRNHFANFIVLGVAPAFTWILARGLQRAGHGDSRNHGSATPRLGYTTIAISTGLAVAVLAVGLSASRGGTIALLVAATFVWTCCWKRRLIGGSSLWGGLAFVVVVVGILSIHGYERWTNRLDDLTAGDLEAVDAGGGRRQIWAANVAAIRDGWLTGSGAGSHRDINRAYLTESSTKSYSHAENGYLQIVTENGLPGVVLLLASIALCVTWGLRAIRHGSDRIVLCAAAALAGLMASMAHSLVDFVWFIPACMSVTILLAAALLRCAQLSTEAPQSAASAVPLRRPRWFELSATVGAAGVWSIWTLMGPAAGALEWDNYLRSSAAHQQLALGYLQSSTNNGEQSLHESNELLTTAMIDHLEQVVRANPQAANAHLRLAQRYLELFELKQQHAANSMPVSQISDAAIRSQFSSAGGLREWLQRACPENYELLYAAHRHARCAVGLGPLQGEGYLYLANLCFLDGDGPAEIEAYVDQGLRVCPADGDVRFEVGKLRLLSGNFDDAMKHWIRCYRDHGTHQLGIIHLLAGRLPADQFVAAFQPDWHTLSHVWRRYRELGQPEDLEALLAYATKITNERRDSDDVHREVRERLQLCNMLFELKLYEPAVPELTRALDVAPSNYSVRQGLGMALLETGEFKEAEIHLRWCLQRRPHYGNLQVALLRASKGIDAAERR